MEGLTSNRDPGVEGIDLEKLSNTVRKNVIWIIAIFVASNLATYLYIRWTKDLYESYSELKLGIKQDAPELGIKNFSEDPNLNMISGEIEQIKSRLFFNRVIDSMQLWEGYYSSGKVLNDEMYKRSPFLVTYRRVDDARDHIADLKRYVRQLAPEFPDQIRQQTRGERRQACEPHRACGTVAERAGVVENLLHIAERLLQDRQQVAPDRRQRDATAIAVE